MKVLYFITPLLVGIAAVLAMSLTLKSPLGLVIPALALIFSIVNIINFRDDPERKTLGWWSLGGTLLSIGVIAALIVFALPTLEF